MAKDMAAVVAAAADSRGIGYQGQLVRLGFCRVLLLCLTFRCRSCLHSH